jgi:hypothetical protein
MNKILSFFVPLMFVMFLQASAQTSENTVVVHKDPRLDMLVNKQIEINEITTRNARRFAPGFRILVISSNNRNKVTEAKTRIYRQFPELKAYMLYQSPFFRLKVGNFRDRDEAEEYLRDISRLFDGGVYIVPDTVEIKLETDN